MRNIVVTVLSLFLVFLLTNAAWATPALPEPKACPRMDIIKKVGISYVVKEEGSDKWIAIQVDRYSTDQSWQFTIVNIPGSSQHEALKHAKASLVLLVDDKGPIYDPNNKTWYCTYRSSHYHQAFAYVVGPQSKKIIRINF